MKTGARARQHIFLKKRSFPEPGVVCTLPKWQTGSKAQKASSLAGDFVFRCLKMAQKVSVCRRNAFSWQGPEYLDVSFLFSLILSLGHTRKFIPPPWYRGVGGGVMEPRGDWWNPSPEFLMLQYFETTLPSMESVWSSQQDEVHFKGVGTAGALWRHQQWSPTWPPSWILQIIKN